MQICPDLMASYLHQKLNVQFLVPMHLKNEINYVTKGTKIQKP